MPTSRTSPAVPTSEPVAAETPPPDPPAGSAPPPGTPPPAAPLLRIQEVAAETGATTRAVRYYEEIGLLQPAARSDGDYRLYDASDVERIRHIRELRDVAGFSLTEIGELLEDEAARATNRAVYRATEDPVVRRQAIVDSLGRIDHSIGILQAKSDRLATMILDAESRRERLHEKLAALAGDGETER